jgi:hypothetical protein
MGVYAETEVRVAVGHDADLTRERANGGGPSQAPAPSAGGHTENVTATLAGVSDAFDIVSAGNDVQNVADPARPALWTWIVKPKLVGKHLLSFSVATVDENGSKEQLSMPDPLEVQVVIRGFSARFHYFTDHTAPALQALLALFPAGAIGALLKGLNGRKKRSKSHAHEPAAESGNIAA